MNTTYNPLVEDYSVENSDTNRCNAKTIQNIKQNVKNDEYEKLTFRGKEIELLRLPKIITENAIDTSTQDVEENNGFNNIICYDGNRYTMNMFFKTQFKDYKKYAYKVHFKNDYITYLSRSQRAKLQYQILAQYYDIIDMNDDERNNNDSENVKYDLMEFFSEQNNQTMQTLFGRMIWEDGIERMITFGASLDVTSYKENNITVKIKKNRLYCYKVKMDSKKAIYTGVKMTWEEWVQRLIKQVEVIRNDKKSWGIIETPKETEQRCIKSLYYQDGIYLTLPKTERDILLKYLNDYINHGKAVLAGLSGEIPNADISFTIDFNTDIEIVKQHDNTKHNQKMGKDMVINTFSRLVGNAWTTQEIYSQGFNKGNLDRFVKYGLIKRIKRGHYIRVYK